MQKTASFPLRRLIFSGVCLGLCLALPFLTGQLQSLGNALCPMHLPVFLAAFLCGPWWGLAVGFTAPLLRSLLFTMPALYPSAIAMAFELAGYGLCAGLIYRLVKPGVLGVYKALVPAMLCGRVLWGLARLILAGLSAKSFTLAMFIADGFTTALPGIALQLVLLPLLVAAIERAGFSRT